MKTIKAPTVSVVVATSVNAQTGECKAMFSTYVNRKLIATCDSVGRANEFARSIADAIGVGFKPKAIASEVPRG